MTRSKTSSKKDERNSKGGGANVIFRGGKGPRPYHKKTEGEKNTKEGQGRGKGPELFLERKTAEKNRVCYPILEKEGVHKKKHRSPERRGAQKRKVRAREKKSAKGRGKLFFLNYEIAPRKGKKETRNQTAAQEKIFPCAGKRSKIAKRGRLPAWGERDGGPTGKEGRAKKRVRRKKKAGAFSKKKKGFIWGRMGGKKESGRLRPTAIVW